MQNSYTTGQINGYWPIEQKIRVKGTPVIVFGNYDFSAPKPWLKLVDDPHALDLDEAGIEKVIEPVLYEIMREQKNREEYEALKNNSNSIQ